MPEEIREYLRILQSRYPEYRDDAIILANIGMKINNSAPTDKQAEVMINQCRVAWEVFNSVHCLIAYDYGLGAMSLGRNLFELVLGTVFLADHPEKRQDFIDSGKIIAYELAEKMGADEKYLKAFKEKSEYDKLEKKLGRNKWHGTTVRGLAESLKLGPLYDSFYKESSSIAHGDSYATLGYKSGRWQFSKDVRSWSKYCEVALTFSFLSMAILYHKVVHSLNLPLRNDIEAVLYELLSVRVLVLLEWECEQ